MKLSQLTIMLTIACCTALHAGEWINGVLQEDTPAIQKSIPTPAKNKNTAQAKSSKTKPVTYHSTTIDPKKKSELTTLEDYLKNIPEELREEGKLLWKKLTLEIEKQEKQKNEPKKIIVNHKDAKTAPVTFYQGQ